MSQGLKRVTILIGHSGSGKDTVLKELRELGMKGVVSYTTRQPRHYEVEGVDYHFVTKEKFIELLERGFFAEYAEYINCFYGCSSESLVDNSAIIVEPKGLAQLKEKAETLGIELFVVHVEVDEEVRRERLKNRGDNSVEIQRRIESDRDNFKNIKNYSNFNFENNDNDYKLLHWKVKNILYPTIQHKLHK